MIEQWKQIEGFELYEVSNLGRVRKLGFDIAVVRKGKPFTRKYKGGVLSTTKNNCGYEIVTLNKDNKIYCCTVHRLVAKAFIPNPNNLSDVNHKDENKLNNRVDNLEWLSHRDNMNYGGITDKMIKTRKNNRSCNLTEDQKLIKKMVNGWMPNIKFKTKRVAVIHNGIEYYDRIDWCGRNNRTLARCCQLYKLGEIELKTYFE
jgi:hypothetical protein